MLAMMWWFGALLTIFALSTTRVTNAQDVLAVSSFQTCTSVSYGDVQLSCDETESTVSVLVVRTATTLSPGGNVSGSPTSFEFQMASLPPRGGTAAGGDSNLRCITPDQNGQCGASQRVTVTVQAEPPVRRFRLREIPMLDVPFSYYFSLVDGDCSDLTCINRRLEKYKGDSDCSFQGTDSVQSQDSTNAVTPTAEQIQQWFTQTQRGAMGIQPGDPINCPTRFPNVTNYTTPNGLIVNPGSTVMRYNFRCKREDVKFYTAFYQLAPMCRVFRVEQSEVVGRVTVTLSNVTSGVLRSVVINTAQYETAGVTPEGDMLVRILNVQSPSDTLGETLSGVLIICGDSVPVGDSLEAQYEVPLIDMFPSSPTEPDPDVLVNPWNALSDDQVAYTYPTPQLINLVRNSALPAPNQFYFYLEPVDSLSVGEDCGQLGVLPDYYRYMTQQTQSNYFKDQKARFPYSKIRNLNALGTCVPEFGLSYRGLNVTTPCSAVAYFHTQNQGNVTQRMTRALGENRTTPRNLPRGFTMARQNVALKNDYMYMYTALDAQWEVSIALRASLLGVISTPYTGTIKRTEFTGCALQSGNPNKAGTLAGYVCSGVPEGSPTVASYVLYAECDPASGLIVRTPTQLATPPLGTGECTLITFTLIEQFAFTSTIPRYCTLYLGSSSTQVVFAPNNSLTLDSTTLLCSQSNPSNYSADNLLIDPADALTLSNATIVSRKNYTAPEVPDKSTAWYLWGFLSIALGVVALVVIGVLLFIWARIKMSQPAKMKVVD